MNVTSLEKLFEDSQQLENCEAVLGAFIKHGRDCGFDMAIFMEVQTFHQRHSNDARPWIAEGFSEGFLDHYFTTNLADCDPLIAWSVRHASAFKWNDVRKYTHLTEEQRSFFRFFDDGGVGPGYNVPLFGPNGAMAIMGVGMKSGTKRDLSPEEYLYLQHGAYHLYNCYKTLESSTPTITLSPREAEVMHWVAAGKSNAVIADILNLSDHTVDSLMRRVFHKLNVHNRVAAALKAVQLGLIQA